MITFINFAPIEFMGGAEKWINDTVKKLNKFEQTTIINVSPTISNIYAKVVLNRSFSTRSKTAINTNRLMISPKTLIPFSKNWKRISQSIKTSRLIYMKFEITELAILLYFGGFNSLSKTVAGMHSPFKYSEDFNQMAFLHRLVYESPITVYFLKKMKRVHVINKRDLQYFQNEKGLKNITFVPHGIDKQNKLTAIKNEQTDKLNILFVGELSKRKGADILLETIKKSNEKNIFHIVGNGPYETELSKLNKPDNFKYYGFLEQSEIKKIYAKCDVLFLPSRGESFGLVFLEAMSAGLMIVNSKNVSLILPQDIEVSLTNPTVNNYLKTFSKILEKKKAGKIDRQKIKNYCATFFSAKKIDKQLHQEIFNVAI